ETGPIREAGIEPDSVPNAGSDPDIQVLIANMALPFKTMLCGSLADYENHVAEINADGIELTPMYSRFMRRLRYRSRMIQEYTSAEYNSVPRQFHDMVDRLYPEYDRSHDWSLEDGAYKHIIRALHSSFRQESGDNGLAARMFPTWRESIDQMSGIQRLTGTNLPAVLYPEFYHGNVAYTNVSSLAGQKVVFAPF